MEESKQLSEKEQLIENALEKVLQGGDTNFKLAIWDLLKAKEKMVPQTHPIPNYLLDIKSDLQRFLIEILSGLELSKRELIRLILEGASYKRVSENNLNKIENIKEAYFEYGIEDFLGTELPQIWLKSLKYDALVKALEDSESDTMKDKEKLAKVKSIIGEVKPE